MGSIPTACQEASVDALKPHHGAQLRERAAWASDALMFTLFEGLHGWFARLVLAYVKVMREEEDEEDEEDEEEAATTGVAAASRTIFVAVV